MKVNPSWLFLLQISFTTSFIIPDEVPSILSVIYSNIPTIKKGTDSRLGWGFRLGNRADFQVLVELGPQLNTQPLANQNTDNNRSSNKRNNIDSLSNLLYAQRQEEKKQQIISNTDGGKWLENWSNEVNNNRNKQILVPKPGLGLGEIDAKSVIPPDDAVKNISQLVKVTTAPSIIKEDLSDVEIKD